MNCKVSLALLVSFCALQAMADSSKSANIDDGILLIDTTDDNQVRAKFEEFKSKYERNYADKEEEEKRFGIFRVNLAKIQDYNRASDSATYGINDFADQSAEDMRMRTGLRPPSNRN